METTKTLKAFIEKADGTFVQNPEVTKLEIKAEIEKHVEDTFLRLAKAVEEVQKESADYYEDTKEWYISEITGGDWAIHFDDGVDPIDAMGDFLEALGDMVKACEKYNGIMEICK